MHGDAQALYQFHAFTAFSTFDDIRGELAGSGDADGDEAEGGGGGAGGGAGAWLGKALRMPGLVMRIVACDVFVALRIIYLACVVQATAMIIRSFLLLCLRPYCSASLVWGLRRRQTLDSQSIACTKDDCLQLDAWRDGGGVCVACYYLSARNRRPGRLSESLVFVSTSATHAIFDEAALSSRTTRFSAYLRRTDL